MHPACKGRISQAPSTYLSSFYYDTLTHHTKALGYLVELVGPGRLLYGSDYPFEMVDDAGPDRVRQVGNLAANDKEAVLGGNAEGLLRAAL
jgi:aminocarboxymuconate-semialdehyde decarboxylase